MAIDLKGNNHQPKGTPNAGRFAPKAGAGDDDDLHEPRHPVGAACTAWGGRFCVSPDDGFRRGPYLHNSPDSLGADDGDMAAFRRSMTVEPSVMGDRDYGEAAAVEGDVVRLYSGAHPRTPLIEVKVEAGCNPHIVAQTELERDTGVLDRFARDCATRRVFEAMPEAERVDDYTVRIPTVDGGHADIRFDGDTALMQSYDEDGRPGLDDWACLDDIETPDIYMQRVAAMVDR